jgi:hypothetical protein
MAGVTTWAVDLKDVGAIYPMQGYEVLLVILGFIFWIGWHVMQLRQESAEVESEASSDPRGDETKKAIDRY